MPHGCCILDCRNRRYRTITIDGKEVKVSFHKIPDADTKKNAELRRKWLHAIRRDVGMSCLMLRCSNTTRLVDNSIMYVLRIHIARSI